MENGIGWLPGRRIGGKEGFCHHYSGKEGFNTNYIYHSNPISPSEMSSTSPFRVKGIGRFPCSRIAEERRLSLF